MGKDAEKMIAGTPEYAFNEYLQICAEFGVIPFLLFISIIAYAIAFAIKNNKSAPLSGLVSLLVFASMSYPFSLLPFIICFILLLTLCTNPTVDNTENNRTTVFHTAILLFCICATIYLAAQKKQIYRAYQSWGSSRYLYDMKAYSSARKKYADEYSNLKSNVEYLFQYGQILSYLGNYNTSNSILKRATAMSCDPMLYNVIGKNYQSLGEYNKAAENFTLALNMVPHRLYSYYLLAQMHIENNDLHKAKDIAEKLLSIDIKISSSAADQMKDEMKGFLESFNTKQ